MKSPLLLLKLPLCHFVVHIQRVLICIYIELVVVWFRLGGLNSSYKDKLLMIYLLNALGTVMQCVCDYVD